VIEHLKSNPRLSYLLNWRISEHPITLIPQLLQILLGDSKLTLDMIATPILWNSGDVTNIIYAELLISIFVYMAAFVLKCTKVPI